ncbi:MAG: hypothetical protein VSS75_034050, partial [Candidatus Parabeggiatoa sp.]|nr:hypothetical protein [Candidatus Parabeggiatoa sp.]
KAAQEAAQEVAQEASAEKKRVLIRQLHRKFSSLPKRVVQKIEATDDRDQLDNWLDQIIVADSLAERERLATGKSDNTLIIAFSFWVKDIICSVKPLWLPLFVFKPSEKYWQLE